MLLNKDAILKANDRDTVIVDVPEWGEGAQVKLAALCGRSRDAWEIATQGDKDGKQNLINIRARLAVFSIVDENNKLIFDERDIEALGQKSATALDRIFDAALALNKMRNKDIEETAKN